jgi:hypothetical protein
MKATSMLKDYGNGSHSIIGIRKQVFAEKFEIYCRESTKLYIYEFSSTDKAKIEQLFAKMFFVFMTADTWEDFAKWVTESVEQKKLPVN